MFPGLILRNRPWATISHPPGEGSTAYGRRSLLRSSSFAGQAATCQSVFAVVFTIRAFRVFRGKRKAVAVSTSVLSVPSVAKERPWPLAVTRPCYPCKRHGNWQLANSGGHLSRRSRSPTGHAMRHPREPEEPNIKYQISNIAVFSFKGCPRKSVRPVRGSTPGLRTGVGSCN